MKDASDGITITCFCPPKSCYQMTWDNSDVRLGLVSDETIF